MTLYVDTSTIIKLLIEEPGSARAKQIWLSADDVISAKIVAVEAHAALAAARRAHRLNSAEYRKAVGELNKILAQMTMIDITDDLVEQAIPLTDRDALRGYDAIHLAAALLAGVDTLTSSDADLCAAAHRNGLHVANPTP